MEIEHSGARRLARRLDSLSRQNLSGLEVPVAHGFTSRPLGLSHLDRSLAGNGLLIPRCGSIHTIGMLFPIDVFFLGDDDQILATYPATPPGRLLRCRGSRDVLELVTAEGGESRPPCP